MFVDVVLTVFDRGCLDVMTSLALPVCNRLSLLVRRRRIPRLSQSLSSVPLCLDHMALSTLHHQPQSMVVWWDMMLNIRFLEIPGAWYVRCQNENIDSE